MNGLIFHKMEGAGNDFVVIDNRESGLSMEEIISLAPKLCDRRFGVGADGLLVLESAQIEHVDYTMIYRNADGSDAGMCGNGSRCLALFAANHGFSHQQRFNVHDRIYEATVDKIEHHVSVLFPNALAPKKITINKKKYLQVYTGTEHACGTGALASAIATHFIEKNTETNFEYAVTVKGGTLGVSFRFDKETNTYTKLILSGPAHFVFTGSLDI